MYHGRRVIGHFRKSGQRRFFNDFSREICLSAGREPIEWKSAFRAETIRRSEVLHSPDIHSRWKARATMASSKDATKLTPMMERYMEVKGQNPGSLLLFRMGDFYELFHEDAEIAS